MSFLGREAEMWSCPINLVGDGAEMMQASALGRKHLFISWSGEMPERAPKKMFLETWSRKTRFTCRLGKVGNLIKGRRTSLPCRLMNTV